MRPDRQMSAVPDVQELEEVSQRLWPVLICHRQRKVYKSLVVHLAIVEPAFFENSIDEYIRE